MRDLSKNECDALEALIDGCGVSHVLMAMSDICGQKATHVATNWQDVTLAKRWAKLEGAIGMIVSRAEGM